MKTKGRGRVRSESPPPIPAGNLTPNRPAAFTNTVSDYGFPVAIPVGVAPYYATDPFDAGWGVANTANGHTSQVTDQDGGISSPTALRFHFFNGGSSSVSVGKVWKYLPVGTRRVYVAQRLKHDANFEWNPVANKLVMLYPPSGPPLYFESRMNSSYWQVFHSQLDILIGGTGTPPTLGTWINVEWLADADTGEMKCWLNGSLIWSISNFSWTGSFSYLQLDSTWGGTSAPRTRDSYRWHDHILIATAPNL